MANKRDTAHVRDGIEAVNDLLQAMQALPVPEQPPYWELNQAEALVRDLFGRAECGGGFEKGVIRGMTWVLCKALHDLDLTLDDITDNVLADFGGQS